MKPTVKSGFLMLLGSMAVVLASTAPAADYNGTVRVGYVLVDEDGNEGVHQPAYNLYDGAAVSLERFNYRFDNGTRIRSNLRNITMNNRNLTLGVSKSGLYGITLHNDQYRREYSFSGSEFTRRQRTSGRAWVEPTDWLKLFGGYGWTDKHGTIVNLFDQFGSVTTNEFDYRHQYFNAGLQLNHERARLKLEYRGSDLTDDIHSTGDRTSNRIKVTAVTPVPRYEQVLLHGGFQHYEWEASDRSDTLTSNTVWGGGQWYFLDGFNLRYSFIFDRARRTGDVSPTDNITNAVYLGKVWRGYGGVTVGYRYQVNDDIFDQVATNGYYFDGWTTPIERLTIRAGFGAETEDINNGATLTGARNFTRHRASVRYRLNNGFVRARLANRQTEHDDIGSAADFWRIGADASYRLDKLGEVQASYHYLDGEYANVEGVFRFKEHIVSGDIFPVEYRNVQAGVGGVYMRSRDDLNVESYQLRVSGKYRFYQTHLLEVRYTAHNFDDFADATAGYDQYFTGNVVELYVVKEL